MKTIELDTLIGGSINGPILELELTTDISGCQIIHIETNNDIVNIELERFVEELARHKPDLLRSALKKTKS